MTRYSNIIIELETLDTKTTRKLAKEAAVEIKQCLYENKKAAITDPSSSSFSSTSNQPEGNPNEMETDMVIPLHMLPFKTS